MLAFKEFNNSICETADAGLAAKASKSGISIGTLRKVYRRGVAAWNSGHRPGTTPQQWGMARVNSYIGKGKGTYHGADKDLREEDLQELSTDKLAQYKKAASADASAADKAGNYAKGSKRFSGIIKATNKQFDNDMKKQVKEGNNSAFDTAEEHLSKANDADAKGDKKAFHAHMANHHDSMSEWHDSKGRSASADKHAEKADYHHEKSLSEETNAVPKDKESGLPKKYVAGLSASTAKARAAHFAKADKLSDRDPEAYKPAPGDATAKTKPSKHTLKYHAMFGEDMDEEIYEACWDTHKQVGMKKRGNRMVPDCVPKNEEFEAQFDLIEEYVEELALVHDMDSETIWETLESITDDELLEAAVDAKGHKSSTGGLTQKGRDYYNRQSGGNLKAPVTTPPSKLKAGSKAANRRKSFCARMSGVDGPMKKPNGEPTRKALALRKWNC
jgi:hypothetical protein